MEKVHLKEVKIFRMRFFSIGNVVICHLYNVCTLENGLGERNVINQKGKDFVVLEVAHDL